MLSPRNKSGGLKLNRPISSGIQEFETNEAKYPLTEPISKIEALSQTSGEAQYITDMPVLPGQLYAAFVIANAPANSKIFTVNPSKALVSMFFLNHVSETFNCLKEINGVIAYFDKDDIPGENTFMPKSIYPEDEELFCSGVVQYYSQPIGIVVCESQELAEKAAELVEVVYLLSEVKPLLTIRDVLRAERKERIENKNHIKPSAKLGHFIFKFCEN